MKKGLSISLIGLVAAGAIASAVPAFADTYTGVTSGETEFIGRIGKIDPETEDPDPGIPPAGDPSWIKVSLPSRIVYWSDSTTGYTDITSATHTVTNLSNYPVKVSLGEFKGESSSTPDIAGLQTLNINGFKLVDNAALEAITPSNTLSTKLAAGGNKPATIGGPAMAGSKDWSLDITGTVAPGLTGTKTLNNKLVFEFKALDAAGNEVTP
ncbi:MAG: hypothetical protein LBV19_01985 [Streptococcaceae bacterium]|jgi:hypothetical protein|nr:hypothetical protein [Streptococcaceae bacterium]